MEMRHRRQLGKREKIVERERVMKTGFAIHAAADCNCR